MCAMISSFQFKSRKSVLTANLISVTLFSVNMLMLHAIMGVLLNVIAIVRAIVYLAVDKIKIPPRLLQGIFISSYFLAYLLAFTVFGTEPSVKNLIVELLPVIGMTALTFGFAGKSAKEIRLYSFINSPCWLVYNIFSLSIGGFLCEVFSIISNTYAFFRYDLKKTEVKEAE